MEQNYFGKLARMDSQIASVRSFILSNWNNTVRPPSLQSPVEIPLPQPFTIPFAGSLFHPFSYWETFFTNEGLLRDGLIEQAVNNVNNILYLINTYGFMPGYALLDGIYLSQPPVTSLLVEKIYKRTHDLEWLSKAYDILEKEYAFWMTFRLGHHGLNHYGWHGYPKEIETFQWVIKDRLVDIPQDITERLLFQAHAIAETESGWDFTPRFERCCANYYAIDLNSLLYFHESNITFFSDELGNHKSSTWRKRALQRHVLINKLCWENQSGFYFDYNNVTNQRSNQVTAAAYFALWAGIPSMEQANQMVGNLTRMEYASGLVACCPHSQDLSAAASDQIYQWNFPNALPPLQYAAIAGLARYGFFEEAKRLASKYIACVTQNFIETGNLWTKYNAVTGSVDSSGDSLLHPLLGWTAGTFLYALEVMDI